MRVAPKSTDAISRPRSEIVIRTLQQSLGEHVPRYWVDDNPYLTHMLNAMSCIFPGGERFFMASVQHYAGQVQDKDLLRDIRRFSAQEALHGQEHAVYNRWAKTYGYALDEIAAVFEQRMAQLTRWQSPVFKLAKTAALEHLTAVMGRALLSRPEMLELFHPSMRPLWVWHAIEEMEHKAVAFDVLA